MDRNLAAARWYFPDDYFANCVAELGPQRTSLFFAQVGDQLASAYFLMHAFGTAYYHFGASNEDYFQYRPNDLLMLETALWAHRAGYRRYHLGGGVTSSPDDALFRFKSSFGKCTAPLYTYFRIHNHESYEQLASLKRQHEIAVHGCESVSNFVPAYRRPFVADGIS
jgi:lipid II:glycine glycyltransferase (peptidoglycan interpeptide bridge formation enzyme)